MTIGENIQKARKFKGISQEDMANELNVTRQCVSLWETDQTVPTLDNLKAISVLLNVSIDKLTDPNFNPTDEEQVNLKIEEQRLLEKESRRDHRKSLFTKLGFTLAMLSILLSFVPALGTFAAIAGLVFSIVGYRKNKLDILNIIDLMVSAVFIVASIVIACFIA